TLPDPELPVDSRNGQHFPTQFGSIRMEYTGPDRTNFLVGFDETRVSKVRVENTTFRYGGLALDVHFWSLAGTTKFADAALFQTTHKNTTFTGPEVRNLIFDVNPNPVQPSATGNSINGLFVDIPFVPNIVDFKGLTSEWDDVGVPYVMTQRLNVT